MRLAVTAAESVWPLSRPSVPAKLPPEAPMLEPMLDPALLPTLIACRKLLLTFSVSPVAAVSKPASSSARAPRVLAVTWLPEPVIRWMLTRVEPSLSAL